MAGVDVRGFGNKLFICICKIQRKSMENLMKIQNYAKGIPHLPPYLTQTKYCPPIVAGWQPPSLDRLITRFH